MRFSCYLQLFSIIVFGSIISEGWRYDVQEEEEICIINKSYSTCQLATTVGILAFVIALGTASRGLGWPGEVQ